MKNKQLSIGLILIAILFLFGFFLSSNKMLPLFLFAGVGFGYALAKSSFGFAGGIKIIYLTGDGALTYALMLMLTITLTVTLGLQWAASINGAVPAFLASEGDKIIAGTGNINSISLNLIIGGLLFGMGMLLAGGCASGVLVSVGTGSIRGVIALVFFGVGGLLGDNVLSFTKNTFMSKGPIVYLPTYFGYIGGYIISIALVFITYFIARKYELKRKTNNTFTKTWETDSKNFENKSDSLNSEIYQKFIGSPWTVYKSAVVISIFFIFTLVSTNASWGVSGPYSVWLARVLQVFGINPTEGSMAGTFATAAKGVLNHSVSIRNFGIIFGAALATLFCGVFQFDFKIPSNDALFASLGGILMGIGAKLANGCNVGAFYSSVATFSLSGWVFMLCLILGGIISMKLFAGKLSLIPKK